MILLCDLKLEAFPEHPHSGGIYAENREAPTVCGPNQFCSDHVLGTRAADSLADSIVASRPRPLWLMRGSILLPSKPDRVYSTA